MAIPTPSRDCLRMSKSAPGAKSFRHSLLGHGPTHTGVQAMADYKRDRRIMSQRRTEGAAIVVTGAAGGIGGGITTRLLADGWTVVATDLDAHRLAKLKSDTNSERLLTVTLDIA